MLTEKQGDAMVERRKDPRVTTGISVECSREGSSFFGDIVNISRNGFFIKADTIMPVDTELTLRIRLPEKDDGEPMQVTGRVVWAKQVATVYPAGMGIEFVREPAGALHAVADFVDTQQQEQPQLCTKPRDGAR